MVTILIVAFALAIIGLIIESADYYGSPFSGLLGGFIFGALVGLLAQCLVGAGWSGTYDTHYAIQGTVQTEVVNGGAVYSFTTTDGKKWSLPTDDVALKAGNKGDFIVSKTDQAPKAWTLLNTKDQKTHYSLSVTP